MSNSCLIRWFEQLLFGASDSPAHPPLQAKNLILRMEAESVPWSHITLQGGFTSFPYQVHGDLNTLLDHLEKEWLDGEDSGYVPRCKTRAVEKFWNQLQLLLAKRKEAMETLPTPLRDDDAILRNLLDPQQQQHAGSYEFQSAAFWGQVARRFINLRRPESVPAALASTSSILAQRAVKLYDMTCMARGQVLDPLTMHLVHHAEYVNAAHWQTPKNLEAFMHDRPSHPLSLSVQALLKQTVDQLLQGEPITAYLTPCSRLDALLHNIRVIHESVQQVPQDQVPPKLIDIFQRLLALSYRDNLWEKEFPPATEPRDLLLGTSMLYLTEQLRIAEREKRLLWNHVIERAEESGPRQPLRICSDSLCASDRSQSSRGGAERERQSFQY